MLTTSLLYVNMIAIGTTMIRISRAHVLNVRAKQQCDALVYASVLST